MDFHRHYPSGWELMEDAPERWRAEPVPVLGGLTHLPCQPPPASVLGQRKLRRDTARPYSTKPDIHGALPHGIKFIKANTGRPGSGDGIWLSSEGFLECVCVMKKLCM